ncbi:MAG: hypothetical protein Q4A87_02400 [Streptococcus sp.]|nr:hypothetical protein [Streptococcus sp.]
MKNIKKIMFMLVLAVSVVVLTACSSTNGKYVYEGNLSIITDAKVTLTIKGDKGTMSIKGSALGLTSSSFTDDIAINQKEKTITDKGATLKYELKGDTLKIVSDSSNIFNGKEFKKVK